MIAIDTKIGGWRHDVLRDDGAAWVVDAVSSGWFDAVFVAPPCSSFSVRHPVKLRSSASPEGVQPMPREWAAYVRKHNRLAEFAARVIQAAATARVPVGIENPADRGSATSGAGWDAAADHGSIWQLECMQTALAAAAAHTYTFAQCGRVRTASGVLLELGSEAQKWTSIAASPWLAYELAPLADALCEHGEEGHKERLAGKRADGTHRATAAAAYPRGMATFLADALERAAWAQRAARMAGGEASAPDMTTELAGEDGRASAGRRLGPVTRSAIERARRLQLAFASTRNHNPASAAELKREAFSGNVHARTVSAWPKSACKALRRQPVLHGSQRLKRRERRDAGSSGGPEGEAFGVAATVGERPPRLAGIWHRLPDQIRQRRRVHINELYLEGVYESEVQSWLALADAAAAAIQRGEQPPPVPTRVIEQSKMPEWARGVVWDCQDPTDCNPVERSTRETPFPGRQLDRAEVRRVADLLGWEDTDIISQIGEGGIESRADCELVTILTFHHDSLLREVEKAEADVAKHMAEGWVAPPARHLPFVPCRLQPRGVVMQSRTRLREDGTVEDYLKPRVTTDGSAGGPDSVNAAVPEGERGVALPSGQTLGRGWAICQSAFDGAPVGEGGGTAVEGYCIDAESAYSFCPVQHADLWQQVFCWWGADGTAGFATDRRMGFGGAFAPNRFERVSTFVGAYAQHLQSEFDSTNPLPACAQRWVRDREALQRRGELPAGEQCFPRYLQSFIDDFTGAAPADIVDVPAWLELEGHYTIALDRIVFENEHMEAAGCRPARRDTRVHVHARLTVLALRRLGLVAAPHKIACGTPLPALGLRFNGAQRLIDCPPGRVDMIVAACDEALEAAERLEVDRERAGRLTGRLGHLTQLDVRLRQHLHAGYRLSEARWAAGGRMRAPRRLRLRGGSAAHVEWQRLLETARAVVSENRGAAMAPTRHFPAVDRPGSLVVVTDASGEDGVGGYALLADAPHEVFVVAEWWPADIAAALSASADAAEAQLRRRHSAEASPDLPMPAGELGGQLLVASLAARAAAARGLRVRRVFGVGDCQPAARALDALHSAGCSPHMRSLAAAAATAGWPWLGIHVGREANVDADRLSHPGNLKAVLQEVERAGWQAHHLSAIESDWAPLREAISVGTAHPERRRYKRRRRGRAAPDSAQL